MKLLILLAASALQLVPAPKSVTIQEGECYKSSKVWNYRIKSNESTVDLETYLESGPHFGVSFSKSYFPTLRVVIGESYFKGEKEGYELQVSRKGVLIKASSDQGAFYGIQSLIQLSSQCDSLPLCTIIDEPAMSHRGLMFDVVRHFRSVDFVCRQLDAMAALKMNRMHFHLTDNAAWRIKLDSHPELVKTAFRPNVRFGTKPKNVKPFVEEPADYVPGKVNFVEGCYGGYYSKENIRQILEYARLRHIEIIPEIEMPGHSAEVLNVHPELCCNCERKVNNVVCPGKESTFEFFEEVLAEVMELFPSRYMHVGGDEASKENWKTCTDCMRRMKEEKLTSVEQLQSYMMGRMCKFIESKGKMMIGWDEIMQGGLCDNAIVMSWRNAEHGYKAIEQGHDVIFCPTKYFYLDYYQGNPALEPVAIGGYVPLKTTWSAPIYAGSHIIGVQGNLWCEYVTSDKHFEYMLYPRAFAVAEIGWSPKEKRADYEEFASRAQAFAELLRASDYVVRDFSNDSDNEVEFARNNHLGLGKKVVIDGEIYKSKENFHRNLTDGIVGRGDIGGTWSRLMGKASLTLDLESVKDVHFAGVKCLHYRHSYLPASVEVLVSSDGRTFRTIGKKMSSLYSSATVSELSSKDYNPYSSTSDVLSSEYWSTEYFPFVCNEPGVRYVRFVFVPKKGRETISIDELIVN